MPDCRSCHETKHEKHFYKRSAAKTVYGICKPCSRKYQAKRRKELPDYQRSRYLKRLYGLTIEQYRAMFKKQNGRCVLCDMESKRALAVDHNHKTMQMRELLCGSCNALIGFAKENVNILARSILYLQKHELVAQRRLEKISLERKIKRIHRRNDIILAQQKSLKCFREVSVPDGYSLVRHVGILSGQELVSTGTIDKWAETV